MSIVSLLFAPKIYCSVKGHHYVVNKKITQFIKEYKCSRCGKEMTTNAQGMLVPLTPKLKQIHLGLQRVMLKRRSKGLQVVSKV